MFAELKFIVEKSHKGEFDVGHNDVKQGITVNDYIYPDALNKYITLQ